VKKSAALVLICLTIAITASIISATKASGATYTNIGVQAGSWWEYTSTTWTSNPTFQPIPPLAGSKLVVTSVSGTLVTAEKTWYFTNGSYTSFQIVFNPENGTGWNALVCANLSAGDYLNAGPTSNFGSPYTLNDTSSVWILGPPSREVNIFNATGRLYYKDPVYGNVSWYESVYVEYDKLTGIAVQGSITNLYESQNGTKATTRDTYTLLDTNLWSSGYKTHWYAGSIYPTWLPTQNASEIYMSITVPSSPPKATEEYFLILSAWDSNGSYDQIGFGNFFGTWALAYSWTSGPLGNLTYHSPSYLNETITLTEGATYTFLISVENGVALFRAELGTTQGGATPAWSLSAPTGGNYLILESNYSGYIGYTDYEEVWYTDTPGGSPNYNFYFYNNYWESLNGTTYSSTWTTLATSPPNPPSNVTVQINGNTVLVDNNYKYATSPTDYTLLIVVIVGVGAIGITVAVVVLMVQRKRQRTMT
jgi:hypothetical protein